MTRHVRIALLIVGAVLVMLMLVGCDPYVGAPGGPTVAAWGDSIMGLDAEEIPPALTDHYQVSLDFHSGWSLDQLQVYATSYAATNPHDVVISAGTNDAYQAEGPWNGMVELGDIAHTIDLYPSSTCVAWINLNEQMPVNPTTGVDAAPHAVGFNAALRYWATRRPQLRIVDLNAALDYLGRPNLLLFDGVHLNQSGQNLLAYLVRNALDNGGCS